MQSSPLVRTNREIVAERSRGGYDRRVPLQCGLFAHQDCYNSLSKYIDIDILWGPQCIVQQYRVLGDCRLCTGSIGRNHTWS